ncbi:DUF4445 domain-containing protein [Candidatus Bathyarchaeota archaeon]|nr:DUF4445 domain-containing protein [Candidatus Bathyarchaeota archaeon]
MKQKVSVTFEPLGLKVKAEVGKTIFDIARETGVAMRSECGGRGTCGKCKVLVSNSSAANKLTENERKLLAKKEVNLGFRLACLTKIQRNLVLTIPEESRITTRKIQLLGLEKRVEVKPNVRKEYLVLKKPTLQDAKPDFERITSALKSDLDVEHQVLQNLPEILREADWKITATVWGERTVIDVEDGNTSEKVYGLAIDVGTSKIVVYVVDLKTGKVLGMGAIENPQMMYGEDIVSRITYAAKDKKYLKILQLMVVNAVNEALNKACNEAQVKPKYVYEAIFVGNVVMHHLFLGIQPKYIALSPYTPVLGKPICTKTKDLGVKINPHGMICTLPVIGGFVGSDAVADALATGIYESDETSLLLDIGTNTEVFLGNKNRLLCCSCASGPAFEGVHIKHGVKAVDGAIEKVHIQPSSLKVKYETINDAPPVGICGTGIIDAVAELFKNKVIDTNGRFIMTIKNPKLKKVKGENCFVLATKKESGTRNEIVITQKDINEIQLAKAAIFTGCVILMNRMKLSVGDIDRVFIAGAFGTHLNPENTKILGLVPDVKVEKIKFVGNTAIIGAKMALVSTEMREKTKEIINKTVYVELAADISFANEFSKALFIPHKELDRFPSVKRFLRGKVDVAV